MKGETNGSSVLPWCSVGEQAAILHMAGVVQVRPVALCCGIFTALLSNKGQNVQRIFKKKKKERKKQKTKNRADHTSSLVFYQRLRKKKKNRKPKIT